MASIYIMPRIIDIRRKVKAVERSVIATPNPYLTCLLSMLKYLFVMVAAFPLHAPAAEGLSSSIASSQSLKGVLTLLMENDTFTNKERDSQYTNGFLIHYAPFDEPDGWQKVLAESLPLFSDTSLPHTRMQVEYSLGQQIFTPDDLTLPIPDELDRPYAGWLYAGTKYLNIIEPSKRQRSLESWEFNLGIVGPGSGARQVQTQFHSMFNGYEPDGWDYQLENELGILAAYQKKWLYLLSADNASLEFDLAPNLGASLGNVYTYFESGLTLRMGRGLTNDYGPMSMRPSAPAVGYYTFSDSISWYVYAGIQGRAVARNIFLDGNTFTESPSVDKETFVGDIKGGIVFTLGAYRLLISHTQRSREFEHQKKNSTGSLYSSYSAVALSIGF